MQKFLFLFPPKEKASQNYYFRARQEISILSKKYKVKIIDPISKTDHSKDKKTLFKRILLLLKLTPKIIKEIRETDVIFIYSSPLSYLFILLAKLNRKRIIFDHFTTGLYNYELYSNPLKKIFRVTDYYIYQSADCIFTHTETMKNLLSKTHRVSPDKIFVLYSCVDTNIFKKTRPKKSKLTKIFSGKKIVMYHGLFHPFHGVNTIIKVAEMTTTKNILFFTLGQKITKGSDNIFSMKAVPYEQLPRYLSLADIWIGALGFGLQGERALSSNMIAAMSMGLPVIVGDCPENKKFIRDGLNGHIIPRNNPQILKLKIQEVISSPKRKIVGQNARNLVKKMFTVKSMEEKLLSALSKLQ